MAKQKYITPEIGHLFGRWRYLGEETKKNGYRKLKVQCSCGHEKWVNISDLFLGKSLSCGCFGREKTSKRILKNLIGKKFGLLTVINDTKKRKHRKVVWNCECNCGNKTEVTSRQLLRIDGKETKSCGCLNPKRSKQGHKWEKICYSYIKNKIPQIKYHFILENKTIPDFFDEESNIIYECKLHDNCSDIVKSIKNYQDYCNKIIFLCKEKKRKNFNIFMERYSNVEFYYPKKINT